MIGLLIKDLMNLKRLYKQLGAALILFLIFAINMKYPPYLIAMMVMMTSMMVINSMSYDEMAKWDKYALAMPILKKDIVFSKYLLTLVTTLIGASGSLIVATVISLALKIGEIKQTLMACGIILLIALSMLSILLPVMFKFGVEKARIIMIVILAIPSFLLVGLADFMKKFNIPQPSSGQIKLLTYCSPLLLIIVLLISYQISVSIFNKKEF